MQLGEAYCDVAPHKRGETLVYKIVVAFAVLALLPGCRDTSNPNSCSIIVLAPLSGTQAAIGTQIDRARMLVQDELTKAGDKSITIREINTGGQPLVARAEVDRAVDRWRPPIIVGSILSNETREFLEPTLKRGVVVLANGSSDPTIRPLAFRRPGDGLFRNWPSDDAEGQAMAEYLMSTGRCETASSLLRE